MYVSCTRNLFFSRQSTTNLLTIVLLRLAYPYVGLGGSGDEAQKGSHTPPLPEYPGFTCPEPRSHQQELQRGAQTGTPGEQLGPRVDIQALNIGPQYAVAQGLGDVEGRAHELGGEGIWDRGYECEGAFFAPVKGGGKVWPTGTTVNSSAARK